MTSHEQIRLARRVIDRRFDSPITIVELSREVALSPYYLIRLFRRFHGQTPYQYLMGRRIARAKDLLRNTDFSITDICAIVGFESLGSFSSLFRRMTGISPRAYRISAKPTSSPTYIPHCIRLRHGLDDHLDT